MEKMKRILTYPFLSMQAEIKKTSVPLTDLMRLLFYLLQLFPALGRHVLSETPDYRIAGGRVPFYESFWWGCREVDIGDGMAEGGKGV